MQELSKRLLTGATLGLLVIITLFLPAWVFAGFISFLLILILITEWPHLVKNDKALWLLTPFYPILPFVLVILMHLTGYQSLTLLLLSLVTAHDTGSYIFGKLWGKHKINSISPGKTWEGFFGGVVVAFVVSIFFFGHNGTAAMMASVFPFVIALCTTALLGDLLNRI